MPGAHLGDAELVDQISHETADQPRPLSPIFRRSDIAAVSKNRLRAASQACGHETQLDERLHTLSDKELVDFGGVLKVKLGPVGLLTVVHDADVFAKNAVETDAAEPDLLLRQPDMFTEVLPQGEVGMAGADAALEKAIKGNGARREIDRGFCGHCWGSKQS